MPWPTSPRLPASRNHIADRNLNALVGGDQIERPPTAATDYCLMYFSVWKPWPTLATITRTHSNTRPQARSPTNPSRSKLSTSVFAPPPSSTSSAVKAARSYSAVSLRFGGLASPPACRLGPPLLPRRFWRRTYPRLLRFQNLTAGDRQAHNEIALKTIRDLTRQVDVVVCAQGSMHALLPELGQTPVPVLTSPPRGVKHAVEVLNSLSQ